ncbi:MAG: hypothetical protein DHS20C18_12960 [Saprospiraceae bacterium]|nr:MAG: hypothetical protein DHS20C18_12960 [Saprospiraceae bacterium]
MDQETNQVGLILQPAEIGQGIKAEIAVLGSQRQIIEVTFKGDNGIFQKKTPPIFSTIQLTPAQPSVPDSGFITLMSGSQKLNISQLLYLPPTVRSEGLIKLDCGYTDKSGNNSYNFNETIAYWALTDTNSCKPSNSPSTL